MVNPTIPSIKKQRAFTLIELLITMTVLGVLLAIAMPNLSAFVVNNRLSSNVNGFIGLINYARSEAIVRSQQVIICAKSTADNSCESSDEWTRFETQMFVDVDGNDDWSAGDILLKTIPAIDTSQTQTMFRRLTASERIRFQSSGLSSTNHKFNMNAVSTDPDYETKFGRSICISRPGRTKVAPHTLLQTCSLF